MKIEGCLSDSRGMLATMFVNDRMIDISKNGKRQETKQIRQKFDNIKVH